MTRRLPYLFFVLALLLANAPYVVIAEDAGARPDLSNPTGAGEEGDRGEEDGTRGVGHWEAVCWEAPDEEMIYCDDVWISSGATGDWNGDGVVSPADF